MNVVYFNAQEVLVCTAEEDAMASELFFRSRRREDYQRIVSGDMVYVRATAARIGDLVHGPPKVLVTTNLTDLVI